MTTSLPTRVLRLLWPYVALWVVIAGVLGGYAWHETGASRQREIASGRIEAENLARVLAAQTTRSVEGFERTLGLIKIVYENARGETRLATLDESLRLTGASDIERRVARYDSSGRMADVSDTRMFDGRVSAAGLPWFAAARNQRDGRVVIGEPAIGRISGRPVLPFAVRLNTETGEFDGVLATALDPSQLVKLLREIQVGERSATGIANAAGRVYAWSGAADGVETHALAQPPLMMSDLLDPAGIVVQVPVAGTDLVAFAALSEERLLGDHRRYARNLVAFTLLTLVAVSLPIVLVARRALGEMSHRSRLEHGIAIERAHARTDALTGIGNRRAYEDMISRCHVELERLRQPFVLAYIDVDRFKQLNDTFGHAVGDLALRRIADALAGCIRRSDLVARLGGDEFAIVMPNAGSQAVVRPFNAVFNALTAAVAAEGWPIGFSIGVIVFETMPEGGRSASELADGLMYEVKDSGRNSVRFATYRNGMLSRLSDARAARSDMDVA